jgi:hypothetical protein
MQELKRAEADTRLALQSLRDELEQQQSVVAHCEMAAPERLLAEKRTEAMLQDEIVRTCCCVAVLF